MISLLHLVLVFGVAVAAAALVLAAASRLARGPWPALARPCLALSGFEPRHVAAFAALLLFPMLLTPSKAQLRHFLDRLLGYPSTRIVLTLRQDDTAAHAALAQALQPFMQSLARPIRYYTPTRSRSGTPLDGYVESDTVPASWRLTGGTLEIAAGGVLPAERLAMLRAGFAALPRFARVDALPVAVPATVHLDDGARADVALLPRTAQFAADGGSDVGCHLEVAALFPAGTGASDLLFGHKNAAGTVALESHPALRDTRYVLAGILPGRGGQTVLPIILPGGSGQDGRPGEAGLQGLHFAGTLRLRPPALDPHGADCGVALPAIADPAVAAAALFSELPMLSDQIASASVTASARFSPWHVRGWTAAPPPPAPASRPARAG
ncbi:MAG: hypothetical protein QM581_14815 [Pseudomonas sp.]